MYQSVVNDLLKVVHKFGTQQFANPSRSKAIIRVKGRPKEFETRGGGAGVRVVQVKPMKPMKRYAPLLEP